MDSTGKSGSTRAFAGLVSLAYLAAAVIWIRFSDEIGAALSGSSEALSRFQTYKGIAFVTATALLIFVLLARRPAAARPLPDAPGPPLAWLLAALVLAPALPLLGVLGYNIAQETNSALRQAQSLVVRVARDSATDVNNFFAQRQRIVWALGHEPALAAGDPQACDRLFGMVSGLHDDLRGIAALDAAGRTLCAAGSMQASAPVPPDWLSSENPLPVIGAPVRGADGRWTVVATYPLKDAGRLRGAVQLAIDGGALVQLLEAPLPANGAMALISHDNIVLARAPDVGSTGQRARDVGAMDELRQGQVRVLRGVDGVERVYAMGKAGSLGLYVVAGVAEEQVYGPVRQNALRSALAGLLVLLLAAAVVVRMTRRITRPMGALADTAEAVGRGELDRRAPEGGPAELGRVATQFNRMLDRLPAMERELRASEERHRVLVEKLARNVPGMIYILTLYPDGRAVMPFASEGVRTMFETTPEEAEADAGALQRRVHPEDAPAMLRAVEASRRTLGHFSAEYRVVLPQAGTRHYLTRSQPEQREDGAIVWYGCTVDITGLKLAEHALAQLNAELEQRVAQRTRELALANEALASFSYSAAHDMRAPLVAINGFAGALRAALKAGQPERGIHLVDRIAANGTHMTEMLDGLLALGRVSRGAAEDRPQDLAVIVGELVGELAVPPGVRIEVAPLPMVLGDRALLRQAFWNLLSNAAKFTAPRGEAGHVRVGWHASGDEVVFEVRDNGVGFDPARAGRMFEAFQRMHAESEFHGTGVGLSIVRRVAERHGGRVWADSQPGEGSVFHLALPRDRLIGTGEGAA